MGTGSYSDASKRDAVHQITVRGYAVREVSGRLGVSTHSLYKSIKLFGDPKPKTSDVDHEAENRRLKRELARVTEEREILREGGRVLFRAECKVRYAFMRHILPSSASGPCAGCGGSTSPASTDGLRNR